MAASSLPDVSHRPAGDDRPPACQLGGTSGCGAPPELKVADSWGDSAWGCWDHAEDAIRQVPSVFLAQRALNGLQSYRDRPT